MDRSTPTPKQLTPRQLEVLELMARGLTNAEIGGVLGIAIGTVKIHVSAVIDALEVSNRTEAAVVLQDFRVEEEAGLGEPVPGFGQRPALAVLPFDPIGSSEDAEVFADGLVEDLTTGLASWRWFPVIARNSAFAYKGKAIDVMAVGRELGARYIVEGSVRRSGDRARINLQLIDARSGAHLHAEIFDREGADIFDVQDEIVESILGALSPALLRIEQMHALRRTTSELTVWDQLYRGSFHLAKQTVEGVREATCIFDAILEKAPDVAPAHAGRGLAAATHGLHCFAGPAAGELDAGEMQKTLMEGFAAFQKAEACGRRALELNDLDWTAHTALGWGLLFQGRVDDAVVPFEHAAELNPSSALVCFGLGMLHLRKDTEEAGPLLAKAIRLSPRDPMLHLMYGAAGGAAILRGDFEAAVEASRRSIACQPAGRALSFKPGLAIALAHLDRPDEARAVMEEVFEFAPNFNLDVTRLLGPPRLMERLEEAFARMGLEIR